MKWFLALIITLCCLTGCTNSDDVMKQSLDLRKVLQECDSCTFRAEITADYGDALYTFEMDCVTDDESLSFTVAAPETICGITGSISDDGGNLTFDDQVLAFEMLADGQVTPVSAPWIFIHTLRSGYIRGCTKSDSGSKLIIDDSYEEDSLQLDVWLDPQGIPQTAEILWRGRRIVSLSIKEFSCL